MGYLPVSFNLDGDESIWIHAVSVGEVLVGRSCLSCASATPASASSCRRRRWPDGQQVARANLTYVDEVFYFPFDLGFIVNRTLRLVRPRLFVMMETEISPNLLRACHRDGVKTALVNGRISTRSYPRYRFARFFFRRVLAHVDRFCMQSEESARRVIEIGAARDRVVVTGSLKFDSLDFPPTAADAPSRGAFAPPPSVHDVHQRGRTRVLRYFRISPTRPVVIAASTLKGEDEHVLEAFQRIRATMTNTLLIIAPRKRERVDDVERLVRRAGSTVARRGDFPRRCRTAQRRGHPRHDGRAGPALSSRDRRVRRRQPRRRRGHNILEPAVFGKPIVFGPHMDNFAEIAGRFSTTAPRYRSAPGASWRRRSSSCSAIRCAAPAWVRRPGRSSRPTAARAARPSRCSPNCCRPTRRATSGHFG